MVCSHHQAMGAKAGGVPVGPTLPDLNGVHRPVEDHNQQGDNSLPNYIQQVRSKRWWLALSVSSQEGN